MTHETGDLHPMGLTCIVCLRKIDSVHADNERSLHRPSSGTSFSSSGHYGSTVFDPMAMGSEYLDITVCDPCLVERSTRGVITHLNNEGIAQRWTVTEDTKKWVQGSLDQFAVTREYPHYYYKNGFKIEYVSHIEGETALIRLRDSDADTAISTGDTIELEDGVVIDVVRVVDLHDEDRVPDFYGMPVVFFRTHVS